MIEPQRSIDPPREENTHKRRQAWTREIIQDVEKYGAPDETSKERKRTQTHSSYVALLCDIIDVYTYVYE